ncbi:hypothetical protein HKD37_01G001694 [Glycine soja]
MASPPASSPPPPPPPPPSDASASQSGVKRTQKTSRLCSLSTRPAGVERPMVHVDLATSKADGPHRKKLRTYLGIMVRDKVDVTYENWKEVPTAQKDLIWEDIYKLLAEKTKKKLEEAAQSGSIDGVIDPSSPVRRHVKWKMAHTKKTGEMTTEAAKEIAEKIGTQGSFIPHGRQDVLTAAIGRPEHLGRVCAAGAGVTIKQYFGSAPRTSRSSSFLPPEELQQLTQQIRDQLEESITEKVTRQLMALFSQMQSQMQSQGLALPPEPLVGPSSPRVSTKGSCIDLSGNDPKTGDSDRCGLYIEANPVRLVALGSVYEGSIVVHNTPLLPGQVKVGMEEVKDADAPIPVPIVEVLYSYYMFLLFELIHSACLKLGHLTLFHEHAAVSPEKPPQKLDPVVDDPLYLMTLTIPEFFLRPYQVTWDATVFGVFNPDFPLYIKHEDLSEIAHGGQCLSISVL